MIKTERLCLRPFLESDAQDLFEYLSEPMVNCFACMKIGSIDEAKKEALKRMKEDLYFAVCLKETGKVIGEMFAHPEEKDHHDNNDTFSLCWMLNKEYHGKGYGFEAAKAFVDFLFEAKDARRLYAYTEDYNVASQKVCEKLGMRREGLFKEFISFACDADGNPIYENTYQYAILKKEWKG